MSEELYKQQVEILLKVLEPFANFGYALKVASQPDGYAWVTLADGGADWCEAEDSEQHLSELGYTGYIVSCNASFRNQAMTVVGNALKAKHFFDAEAVLNTINHINSQASLKSVQAFGQLLESDLKRLKKAKGTSNET
jgi:hypothetical protein